MSWQVEKWDELMESLENEQCLMADGFDDALVGITTGIEPRAVYNVEKMIDILVERDEMEYNDAVEYIEFNVIGAYVGEKTPVYVRLDLNRTCK